MSLPAEHGNKPVESVFPYEPVIASVSIETQAVDQQGNKLRARDLPLFLDSERRRLNAGTARRDQRLLDMPFALLHTNAAPGAEGETPFAARFLSPRVVDAFGQVSRTIASATARTRARAQPWALAPVFVLGAAVVASLSSREWPRAGQYSSAPLAIPGKVVDFAAGLRIHLLPDGIAFHAPLRAKPIAAIPKPAPTMARPKADIVSVPGVTIDARLPPPALSPDAARRSEPFSNFDFTIIEAAAPPADDSVAKEQSVLAPAPKAVQTRWLRKGSNRSTVAGKPQPAALAPKPAAAKPSTLPTPFALPSFLLPQPAKPAPSPSTPPQIKDYRSSESMGDVFRGHYEADP